MMELLRPLGLLGLLGIAILILIYILKPNYQQKIISSTYVWKLSLKYRRKQVPINRLLSILLLILQILVIAACAMVLAQPFIPSSADRKNEGEKIAVIDASADMLAARNGLTRFERAVEEVRALAVETIDRNASCITVILADDNPSVIVYRADSSRREEALGEIDGLLGDESGADLRCSYSQADVESAMDFAEEVLEQNPEAEVLYYTATRYVDNGKVTVVDVSQQGEWNAAILDAEVELEENYYTFAVEVGSYGRSVDVDVYCEIYGINNTAGTLTLVYPNVHCEMGERMEVAIRTGRNIAPVNCEKPVFSYDRVRLYIDAGQPDSFVHDDSITLYGGMPDTIKIQYASTEINPFFSNALLAMRDSRRLRWNIQIDEVRVSGNTQGKVSGYDFYIFENQMPEIMPTDGVVLLVNPQAAPSSGGFILGDPVPGEFTLTGEENHPVTQGVKIEEVQVTRYMQLTAYDGYEPLMYVQDDPVLLVKNTGAEKVGLLAFSLKYSTFSIQTFPRFLYNLFDYFLPSTVTDEADGVEFLFEVGDSVKLNSRGMAMQFAGPSVGEEEEYPESLPLLFEVKEPGSYSVQITLMSGRTSTSYFYVKISSDESDIFRTEDELYNPEFPEIPPKDDKDLLYYLAIALAGLLFLEWLLQVRENY